jgi:SAM-dependent methyltransferase
MQEFKEHEIEWNDEKVGRIWNYYSKTHPYKDNYFSEASGGKVVEILVKEEEFISPVILDFGGGKGFMFEHCKKYLNDFEYFNADFSMDSVNASKKRLHDNREFQDSIYIERLPLKIEDNSFDIIFLIEVLEHLNDEYLDSTLYEIHRLLKPNGKLVLSTPNDENLDLSKSFCPDCGSIYHKWQHVRTVNKENVIPLLKKYQYSEIKVFERNFNKPKSKILNILLSINHFFKKPQCEHLVCISTKK